MCMYQYCNKTTGLNVTKVFDALIKECIDEFVLNNNQIWNKLEKRCREICQKSKRKCVAFCVDGNDNDIKACKNTSGHLSPEKFETYNGNNIYIVYYEGNEFMTNGFVERCQELWENIDY